MATPISITKEIESIKYSLQGSIDDAISFLQKARTKHTRKGWTNLTLDIDTELDGYYDNSSSYAYVKLMGTRLETDVEAHAREARDAQYKAAAEARELRQFQELKKKFGDS